ncbi:unnamed protein product, partial [Adineta steineri]
LPYRIKINANESFINLVQQICQIDMDIRNHCQLPYQQIIRGNSELCSSKIPLHFQYEEIHSCSTSGIKSIAKTNDATLSLYTEQPWLHDNGIASHDMNLRMIHNQSSRTTCCLFECSADCYDEVTVSNIGRYFQNLLSHIFTENTKTIGFDPVFEKIGNLSLLPMNVENLSNVIESLQYFSEIKPASYAQHQIWHDEEHRLHLDGPQLAIYNMVFCYRLSANHTLSVQQLRYALHLVVDKHQSLRTSFVFDTTKNILTQRIVDQQNNEHNRFSIVESIYETDEQLDEIMYNETHNLHVFDLTQGLVFRCHIVRYKQRLLDQHPRASKSAFPDVSFEFFSSMTINDNNIIMIGNSQLSSVTSPININEKETRNQLDDFSLLIQHDLNTNRFACIINASLDLFNRETVKKISQRFHFMFHQLSTSVIDGQISKPIYELSLILSNEQYVMQSMDNTQKSFPSITCIHHEFVYKVMQQPQKLAVEFDNQSLTYTELLYYAQVLSSHLVKRHLIVPGEIICQCVERSLSMIIGIMAIEMSGSVYCPLSPRDPQNRLYTLIEQTQSRIVLIHWLTRAKFHDNDIVLIDIDSILANHDSKGDADIDRLSDVRVTSNDTAYLIFTSGSTGIPKAVRVLNLNNTEQYYILFGSIISGSIAPS